MDSSSLHVVKVEQALHFSNKIFPEKLGVNLKTGVQEVTNQFFWQVWSESQNDDTWNGWICLDDQDRIHGVIVLQQFVHESDYFSWGSPLSHLAQKSDPVSGIIPNIGEISVFIAKHCGRLLLQALEDWVVERTNYAAIALSSTPGAVDWYKSRGYKEVKAFRLEPNHGMRRSKHQAHRYRHRISEDALDLEQDPPSKMVFKRTSDIKKSRTKQCKPMMSPSTMDTMRRISSSRSNEKDTAEDQAMELDEDMVDDSNTSEGKSELYDSDRVVSWSRSSS